MVHRIDQRGFSFSRREALVQGILVGASVLGGTASRGAPWSTSRAPAAEAEDQEAASGWIDAHVHVWTEELEKYPLAQGFTVAEMVPQRYRPEDLFADCRPEGVRRIVLIQMSYYGFDNSYMTDMIAAHPGIFSGVAVIDPADPELERNVKTLASQGVRGFRIHGSPEQTREWPRNRGMQRLWSLAAREGLAICPLINPADIPTVDTLCEKFPETTVVVDHFARIGMRGGIDRGDLDALCRLARFPRVHVKTSAFYALGKKEPPYEDLWEMIARMRDAFGPQRLMWASDAPFQVQAPHTYKASIELIRSAPPRVLSDADKNWILRDTAARVYFS